MMVVAEVRDAEHLEEDEGPGRGANLPGQR